MKIDPIYLDNGEMIYGVYEGVLEVGRFGTRVEAERYINRDNKLKHTPGPWQSLNDFDLNGICTIVGNVDGPDNGEYHYITICDVDEAPDEYLQNARLIAAAPDLLAICQAYLAVLGPGGYHGSVGEPLTNRMRAAVAKATGPYVRE